MLKVYKMLNQRYFLNIVFSVSQESLNKFRVSLGLNRVLILI